MKLKYLINSLVQKELFQEKMYCLIKPLTRLCVYKTEGRSLLKTNVQIQRSCHLEIDYDPTKLHFNNVKECATKWISGNELSK